MTEAAMIVVDASAIIEWLLRGPAAEAIGARFAGGDASLHAPHLLDVEAAQVIRRYWLRGDISEARAVEALADLADLPIRRYGHEPLMERIWALRQNVTAYDAAYLALGEALGAPVLTRDTKLAGAMGHDARVELI